MGNNIKMRNVYKGIMTRCYNKNSPAYKYYGWRGIKMYQEWVDDRNKFYDWVKENIGEKPSDGHTLDRIDNNKNYEPGNLRWATATQQMNNRRNNVRVLYKGKEITILELARALGCSRQNIYAIKKRGGSIPEVIFL